MGFGTRAKDAPEQEFSGDYLRTFRAGETTLQWLEEVDMWWDYWEHFNQTDQKAYPCDSDDRKECPGCNSEDAKEAKASHKYATTVKLISERGGEDIYLPMRVPVSIRKKMETRSERNKGTILNRQYTVIKDGKGLDTEYDVESGDRCDPVSKDDLKENLFDIEEILTKMWKTAWEEEKPKPDVDVDESQDDVFTVADLKKMTVKQLRELAKKHLPEDFDPADHSKAELIEELMNASEEPPY
jgi:hypothetical protein